MNLWQIWAENSEKFPDKDAIVFWLADKEPFRWTYSKLIITSTIFAQHYLSIGIKRGDVCAIVLKHNPFLYPIYMGLVKIGAIPAILAYPNPRLHPAKFIEGMEGMSKRSGLDWILTERGLENVLRPSTLTPGATIKGLFFPLEWDLSKPQKYEPQKATLNNWDDICLLQHSSGTTGLQKPITLSHKAVATHIKKYADAIQLNQHDKIVSWLPLYHDMGLIAAFHLPLFFGLTSIQLDPFEWVIAPNLLLEAGSKEGGTLTWMPNFAFNLMADKINDEELAGLNLRNWRMIINCSEPVKALSHQKFVRRFGRYGFNESAVSTCYAMAEMVFSVSQTLPGKQPRIISVDSSEISKGKAIPTNDPAKSKIFVSSGQLINECRVKIINETGAEVPEGHAGEILIQSDTMFEGYRNYPEKTAQVLKNGWYNSEDIGFILEDHIYVIGRKKDIIIVGGNNIFPEDIEAVIGQLNKVLPGRVVAFGEEDLSIGTEQVSIAAETNCTEKNEKMELERQIKLAGMGINVTIQKVYLLPPRWLIKSSSGKLSRKANKERILGGQQQGEGTS